MRLSQFARKYDLSVQEISIFLQSLNHPPKSSHPNVKLEESYIREIVNHFGLQVGSEPEYKPTDDQNTPAQVRDLEKDRIENTPTEASISGELDAEHSQVIKEPNDEQEKAGVPLENEKELEPKVIQDKLSEDNTDSLSRASEVIQSDKLLEMLASESALPEELEKIKLIKAPKKELTGLKVIGKIEVPNDSKKNTKEKQEGIKKSNQPQISEKEKEERRLKARKKKEEHLALQEKRKKEQEAKRKKQRKGAHYKQLLEKKQTSQATSKPIKKTKNVRPILSPHGQQHSEKRKPKSILGRFWRWLNT